MDNDQIIGLIDYTLLSHDVSNKDLRQFCEKAKKLQPATVCIFPEKIHIVRDILGNEIQITAVTGGFPKGSNDIEEIRKEIISAIDLGADEIDIVIEPRNSDDFPNEFELEKLITMREASKGKKLKVIIETPLLSERKIRAITRMALAVGVDFVKTCTGKRGNCTEEDVKILSYELMRHELTFGEKLGMKISGGISDRKTVMKFMELISNEDNGIISGKRIRIGTSSLIDNLDTI